MCLKHYFQAKKLSHLLLINFPKFKDIISLKYPLIISLSVHYQNYCYPSLSLSLSNSLFHALHFTYWVRIFFVLSWCVHISLHAHTCQPARNQCICMYVCVSLCWFFCSLLVVCQLFTKRITRIFCKSQIYFTHAHILPNEDIFLQAMTSCCLFTYTFSHTHVHSPARPLGYLKFKQYSCCCL